MKHPPIISFTAVNLIPKELSSLKIYHMCFGKVVFVFSVSLEELLGEHNLNAEDFKKVRFELKKYFDMTKKKKKFETKPQNLLLLNFI